MHVFPFGKLRFRLFAGLATAAAVATAVVLLPTLAHTYSSGAPPRYSGPENYCTSCHGSFGEEPNTGTGSVTVETPGYFAPGDSVTFTVHVDNTTPPVGSDPIQGFELSVRDADDYDVFPGTYDLGGSELVQLTTLSDEVYVTHTSVGHLQNTWSFVWVAPTTDAPDSVRVFVAGNAANGDAWLTDDYIYATSVAMTGVAVASEPTTPGAGEAAVRLSAPSPNPARGEARATYTLDRATTASVRLLDGRGRTVRVLEAAARSAGTHAVRFRVDGLAPGVYFLVVETPEGRQARPVTVAR